MSDRFNSMGAFSRNMAAPARSATSEPRVEDRAAGRQDEAITSGASKSISVDGRSLSRRALDGATSYIGPDEGTSEGFPPRLLAAIVILALAIGIIGYMIESAPTKKDLSDSFKFRPSTRQSSGASFSGTAVRAGDQSSRKPTR